MNKNECYTYFSIEGDFNPDTVTEILGLKPSNVRYVGQELKNGRKSSLALWEFGHCDNYNTITANQMEQTLRPLYDKIDVLNKMREIYDVRFCLSIVPTAYKNNSCPALAPSMEIIDFCHATRTEIDIDLYIC